MFGTPIVLFKQLFISNKRRENAVAFTRAASELSEGGTERAKTEVQRRCGDCAYVIRWWRMFLNLIYRNYN